MSETIMHPFRIPALVRPHRLTTFVRAVAGMALGLLVGATGPAVAGAMNPTQVPDPLKTWVPWVLHGEAAWQCPHHFDDASTRVCVWPGLLQLSVDGRGGRFSQRWYGVSEDWVSLPGDVSNWPQEVLLDGKPVTVLGRDDVPSVRLPAGEHRLEGRWTWSNMPESLRLPVQAALLQLTVSGKTVDEPARDADNHVWLGRQQSQGDQAADQAQVQVHRKWVDGVPMRLHTRVHLEVSGKSRELTVARGLLPGWVPQALESPLPAVLTPDGSLRIQARAGVWDLTLVSRHPGPVTAVGLPTVAASGAPNVPGAAGAALVSDEEVWAFEAAPHLRTVSLDGVPSVDPQQTTLPTEWRQFPAYLMQPSAVLNLKEQRRGDAGNVSDKLSLARHAWLSFDGQSMTFHDRIEGRISQATRLEVLAPAQLGRADVGGEDQLITVGPTGLTGLELRRGNLRLSADSLVKSVSRSLPAVGWQQDVDRLSMQLTLPAGWRLLHASGADRADGAWLSRWDLLDFFVVLMITLTVGRLWGKRWGAVTFVMVVLSYHEPLFPLWIWLPLLVAVPLSRAIPDGFPRVQRVSRWVATASLGGLMLLCLPFAISQVRTAMYPVLEQPHMNPMGAMMEVPATPPVAVAPAPSPAGVSSRLAAESVPRVKVTMDRKEAEPLRQQAYRNVDPNARVQTGPGLPTWSGHNYHLQWEGPVLRDQALTLWLLPPWAQKLLTLLRLGLLAALLATLARRLGRHTPAAPGEGAASSASSSLGARVAGGCALFLAAWAPFCPQPAQAKVPVAPASEPVVATSGAWPDPAILAQLKERLTAAPECLPQCAELSRMTVTVAGTSLRLSLDVDADRATAIPVPGGVNHWVPQEVRSNGQPEVLRRGDDDSLWLLVTPGHHRIDLVGVLSAARDTVQLPLLLKPRQVQVMAPGWDVEGLSEGQVADTFQLTRQRKADRRVAVDRDVQALPAHLRVERRLFLDLVWRVETTVRRDSPVGVPALAQVPLLSGEAVTSGGVNVKEGKVQVNLGPQADSMTWSSTLATSPQLSLQAGIPSDAAQTPWSETWFVDASTVWHVDLRGVPPAASGSSEDAALVFYPWPGETLTLQIDRPQAVNGQTLTVDRAVWRVKPGMRASDHELSLTIRSSRGLDHTLTLPEGASLQQVQINGQSRPLRAQGRSLTLPLVPGKQTVNLAWRVDQDMQAVYRTQSLALGTDSVNHEFSLAVPANRWLLWASGPGLGPAILFWGVLVVFLVVAWGVARVARARGVPLGRWQSVLLMVGLTQISPWACAVVIGWFFVMAHRGRCDASIPSAPAWRFNLAQLALVWWTLVMLGILCWAVTDGLLGQPDMQVMGNGSTSHQLFWLQDRVGAELSPITMISVPLLAYRALMLAWALWLAWSLLNWLRWAWTAWSQGALWRRDSLPSKA